MSLTSEQAAYFRSLRDSSLCDLQLSLMGRFAEARRAFREARESLEETRSVLRFIEQVLRERELGNMVSWPVKDEEQIESVKKRRRSA